MPEMKTFDLSQIICVGLLLIVGFMVYQDHQPPTNENQFDQYNASNFERYEGNKMVPDSELQPRSFAIKPVSMTPASFNFQDGSKDSEPLAKIDDRPNAGCGCCPDCKCDGSCKLTKSATPAAPMFSQPVYSEPIYSQPIYSQPQNLLGSAPPSMSGSCRGSRPASYSMFTTSQPVFGSGSNGGRRGPYSSYSSAAPFVSQNGPIVSQNGYFGAANGQNVSFAPQAYETTSISYGQPQIISESVSYGTPSTSFGSPQFSTNSKQSRPGLFGAIRNRVRNVRQSSKSMQKTSSQNYRCENGVCYPN